MKRHFSFQLFFLLLVCSDLAKALDLTFKQVAPDIYASIGELGLRTFENDSVNGNTGFIVPGHVEVCDQAKARRETADYPSLLLDHMVKAVNQGKDLQSAIDSLDRSAFTKLRNYELLKGGNANRVYQEAESL